MQDFSRAVLTIQNIATLSFFRTAFSFASALISRLSGRGFAPTIPASAALGHELRVVLTFGFNFGFRAFLDIAISKFWQKNWELKASKEIPDLFKEFAEIRKKNIRERIEWDLERNEDEKEALIAHHKTCLKLRENS